MKVPKFLPLLVASSALALPLVSCVSTSRYPGDHVESRYDRAENKVDRAEDRYDRRTYSGPGDHAESRYDRRENKVDRAEDRWDRRGAW